MPLFEYRCDACEHEFEQLVRAGETIECPHCQGRKLEKLLSAPAAAHMGSSGLPVMGASCPPSSAPPCSPTCCRLPGR